MYVPQLTAREFEIAPLLIANATRVEISRHLNISEETVKRHIRNILHKFDSVNIRDAYEALSDHMYVFGPDGLHINYFCHSMKRDLYISEGRADAHFKEVLEIEAIYSPMTEFVSEHYVINRKKENMRFNGEPFDKHERIGVNIASVKKLPKPVQPGEQLTFQTTADYIGVFPDNIEWLSIFVPHPIGTIDYWVHFNEGDLPKEVWEHHYNVASSRHFDVFPIELKNNVAHIRVQNPDMKKVYGIRWKWD